jgi:hypothetical protein
MPSSHTASLLPALIVQACTPLLPILTPPCLPLPTLSRVVPAATMSLLRTLPRYLSESTRNPCYIELHAVAASQTSRCTIVGVNFQLRSYDQRHLHVCSPSSGPRLAGVPRASAQPSLHGFAQQQPQTETKSENLESGKSRMRLCGRCAWIRMPQRGGAGAGP